MLNKFDLLIPANLDEALNELAGGQDIMIVAGGTDVYANMHAGTEFPVLMDIKNIRELKGICKRADGGLEIGPLTTHSEIMASREIAEQYPALQDSVAKIGSLQIRNRGTIGGNACNASPANDSLAGLLLYDASMVIKSKNGERTVPAEKFFVGVKKTALKKGEILARIILPPNQKGGSAYTKLMTRKAMEIAVLGTGANIVVDKKGVCTFARITLTSVSPTPVRAYKAEEFLVGKELSQDNINATAAVAQEYAKPKTWRNKEEYVYDMVKTYLLQTFETVQQRMSEGVSK